MNVNSYIFFSKRSNFILPLKYQASYKSNRRLSFLQNRYVGGVLISPNGILSIKSVKISKSNIYSKIASLIGVFTYEVNFELKSIECKWKVIQEELTSVAILENNYSVWAQFYDSESELINAIMLSSDFYELKQALNISESSFAEKLY